MFFCFPAKMKCKANIQTENQYHFSAIHSYSRTLISLHYISPFLSSTEIHYCNSHTHFPSSFLLISFLHLRNSNRNMNQGAFWKPRVDAMGSPWTWDLTTGFLEWKRPQVLPGFSVYITAENGYWWAERNVFYNTVTIITVSSFTFPLDMWYWHCHQGVLKYLV